MAALRVEACTLRFRSALSHPARPCAAATLCIEVEVVAELGAPCAELKLQRRRPQRPTDGPSRPTTNDEPPYQPASTYVALGTAVSDQFRWMARSAMTQFGGVPIPNSMGLLVLAPRCEGRGSWRIAREDTRGLTWGRPQICCDARLYSYMCIGPHWAWMKKLVTRTHDAHARRATPSGARPAILARVRKNYVALLRPCPRPR